LQLKCIKFDDPLAGFKGPYFQGEGRGREGREGRVGGGGGEREGGMGEKGPLLLGYTP